MMMALVNIELGNQDKSSEMDDLRRVSPNNRFQFQSNWSSISSQPMDLMTLIIVMMAMLTKKITISLYTALNYQWWCWVDTCWCYLTNQSQFIALLEFQFSGVHAKDLNRCRNWIVVCFSCFWIDHRVWFRIGWFRRQFSGACVFSNCFFTFESQRELNVNWWLAWNLVDQQLWDHCQVLI